MIIGLQMLPVESVYSKEHAKDQCLNTPIKKPNKLLEMGMRTQGERMEGTERWCRKEFGSFFPRVVLLIPIPYLSPII